MDVYTEIRSIITSLLKASMFTARIRNAVARLWNHQHKSILIMDRLKFLICDRIDHFIKELLTRAGCEDREIDRVIVGHRELDRLILRLDLLRFGIIQLKDINIPRKSYAKYGAFFVHLIYKQINFFEYTRYIWVYQTLG